MEESVAGESDSLSVLGTEMNEGEEETIQQQAEHSANPIVGTETRDEREELRKELEVLKLRSEIARLHQLLEARERQDVSGSTVPIRERIGSREPTAFRTTRGDSDPFAAPITDPYGSAPIRTEEHDDENERDMKASEPDAFTGDSKKIDEFLTACRLFFELQPRRFKSEHFKVLFAISRLKGEASLWSRPYLELPKNLKPAFFYDFNLFVRAMKEQWPVEDEGDEARSQVDKLKQNGRASDYLSKFSIYAPYTGYDDQALINFAENGLKPDLFLAVKHHMGAPSTFDRWKQWVIRFDNVREGAARQLNFNRNNLTARDSTKPHGSVERSNGSNTTTVKTETTLTAVPPPVKIDTSDYRRLGKCYECHQVGHIGRDCPVRKEREEKKRKEEERKNTLLGKAAGVEEVSSGEEQEKD